MIEENILSINRLGVIWKTTPEYRFLIDALNGTLSQVEQKNVIKSSSIRRVVTLKIPREKEEFEIFVKHHQLPWKETLKDLLHISKARNEWKLTHQISSLGINTVLPLAVGEKRTGGLLRESYFISKRIPSCETLHQFVLKKAKEPDSVPFEWKRKLIKDLARMIGQIHKSGIHHKDLHAGNVLMEWEGNNYKLRLLDLDRAQIHHQLSIRKRAFELAQFNMFFTLFVNRTDRLRFFKEYYRIDPHPWKGYQDGAKLVENKTLKMVNKLYSKRDKLCLRENKYFKKFNAYPFSGFYRKELTQGPLREALENPLVFLDRSKSKSLKKASEKAVRRFPIHLNGESEEVVIKSYYSSGLFSRLKELFRASRAKKCWYSANALFQRKIPTAKPIACINEKKLGFVRKSYFVSEYLPNAEVLTFYLNEKFKSPLTHEKRKQKIQILTQLARFVRHIHELWIYHGDLKASNILIEEKAPGFYQFYLIDLDHVKVCCRINRYQRYRNIMQLNKSFLDRKVTSMTDRLTFLKTYLGTDARNKRLLQRSWTVIIHLTQRRLRKTAKSFSA